MVTGDLICSTVIIVDNPDHFKNNLIQFNSIQFNSIQVICIVYYCFTGK